MGSTFGFSVSLLTGELVTPIEVFPSGNGVSNLASVAGSHAKKWWVAVPGPPLAKAIPPEPFAAPVHELNSPPQAVSTPVVSLLCSSGTAVL